MCPVNDVVNKRFKIIVCPACQKVEEGEDPKDSSKDDCMDGMDHPPWSVRYKDIHQTGRSNQKMTGKVLKVQEVPLRVVQGYPVHQGDHDGQGAVDVAQSPQNP